MRSSAGGAWSQGAPIVVDEGATSATAPAPGSLGGDGAGDATGSEDGVHGAEGEDGADGDDGAEEDDGGVHGSFGARFISRRTGDDHDNDLFGLLETRLGDEKRDPVTGYVLARASWDLDGDQGDSPFGSLSDSYDGSVHSRLYEAYADFHEEGFSLLRIGRQQLDETPEFIRFDGVALETAPDGSARHQFGASLGRPNHQDESSPSGDKLVGAWYRVRPWDGARLRLDALHLEDDALLGSENNDLVSARLSQQLGRELHLLGRYTVLEEEPRDFDVRATWTRPETGWLVNLWYHELVRTQSFLAEEFDPFFATLTEYHPYRQGRAVASKSFDTGYDLMAGVDSRQLKESEDEGEFNREFERYFLTGTVRDFLAKDLSLSLTGENWNGDGSDFATWGLDLTRQWSSAVRTSVGTYYALFKNDFLLDEDREDVRTYYIALRYLVDKSLSWSLGIDHEESSDVDNFDTLTAKATWRF